MKNYSIGLKRRKLCVIRQSSDDQVVWWMSFDMTDYCEIKQKEQSKEKGQGRPKNTFDNVGYTIKRTLGYEKNCGQPVQPELDLFPVSVYLTEYMLAPLQLEQICDVDGSAHTFLAASSTYLFRSIFLHITSQKLLVYGYFSTIHCYRPIYSAFKKVHWYGFSIIHFVSPLKLIQLIFISMQQKVISYYLSKIFKTMYSFNLFSIGFQVETTWIVCL